MRVPFVTAPFRSPPLRPGAADPDDARLGTPLRVPLDTRLHREVVP